MKVLAKVLVKVFPSVNCSVTVVDLKSSRDQSFDYVAGCSMEHCLVAVC